MDLAGGTHRVQRVDMALGIAQEMKTIQRPCIECGRLTNGKTRCQLHTRQRARLRNANREHYKGTYARDAKAVRDAAVVCHLCGFGARVDDPWTADHLLAGVSSSALLPAHRSCNSSRGKKTL